MTQEEYQQYVEQSREDAHIENMWGKPARDIITGISNNTNVRPVRAIWELVQNARDVVIPGRRAKIVFKRENDSFIFQHDGRPFTHKTIEALILQTSSKSTDNNAEVGQYGTGFLTTHKFGLKFRLRAPLLTSEKAGRYCIIPDFEIDRSTTDKDVLRRQIEAQWKETEKWGENIEETTDKPYDYTIFKYIHENERERQNVTEAFRDAPVMTPYVMLLNPQVEHIAYIDDVERIKVVYEMPEAKGKIVEALQDGIILKNTITIHPIGKEQVQKTVYYIESKERTEKEPYLPKATVILPVEEDREGNLQAIRFNSNIPQIYIYLPLLGTEQWGFNYLFHSPLFSCDRDSRDSLKLVGNGQNNDYQAECNKEVIRLVNKLIWQYVEKKTGQLKNAKYLVQVSFKTQQSIDELGDYYKGLQQFWREKFETLNVVNTIDGTTCEIRNAYVLDEALCKDCNESEVLLNAIYCLLSKTKAWMVPGKEDMVYWSKTINQWYPEADNPRRLRIDDLARSISDLTICEDDLGWLHTICQHIVEIKRDDLFNQMTLIPNDRLLLQHRDQLTKPVMMAEVVRRALDVMVPEIVENFVHPRFVDIANDKAFDYSQIKECITSYLSNHNNDNINCRGEVMRLKKENFDHPNTQKQFDNKVYEDKFYSEDVVQCVLNLLKAVLPEESSSTGGKLIESFEEFYGIKATSEGRLEKIYGLDERSFYNALIYDSLFRFTLLEDKSGKEEWIKSMVKKVYDNQDSRSFLSNYQVYPDQKGVFKYAEWLKKQPEDTPDRVLEIYDEIKFAGKKESVKDELVSKEYNTFFQGDGVFDTLSHCKEIVAEIALKGYNLNGYEHKSQIVEIIKHFTTNSEDAEIWKRLFPEIESNKGQLMFSTLEDQSKKDSLFSLIEIEDAHRLELIAKMANEPKLQRIYDLGKDALRKEENDEKEMAFKKDLGEFVETILKKELDQQIGSDRIKVNNEQNGQDMILYVDNKPTYYIEVKSRWISKESVLMSTQQHKTSVAQKSHYALCVADMVGTPIEDVKEHRFPEFDKVKDRIEVLMNIGELNERLKDATEDTEQKVHVSSGYQVLVSQKVIEQNQVSFDVLLNELKRVVIDKVKA